MSNLINKDQENALREIQRILHEGAVASGWYLDLQTGKERKRPAPEALCLIHSEISEALEGFRKYLPDKHLPTRQSLEVELADAVIRILDLAGAEGLDIAGALVEKHQYNMHRPDHKIENRRKEGGKKI